MRSDTSPARPSKQQPAAHNPPAAYSVPSRHSALRGSSSRDGLRAGATALLSGGVAVAGLLGWSGVASADIVEAAWAPNLCRYRITNMPDIDQRRAALPSNGGMYCIPTATYNLFAYAAHHGYPTVIPGAIPYQSNAVYVTVSENLEVIGDMMSTSPTGGTNGSGWQSGTWLWNLAAAMGQFTYQYRAGSDCTLALIGKSAVLGGLVATCYGRYGVIGASGGLLEVERDGGHAVTVARIERDPSSARLWVRDPAKDEGNIPLRLHAQSDFASVEYEIRHREFANLSGVRSYIFLGDSVYRILDSYCSLRPASGLTWKQTGENGWEIESLGLAAFGGLTQNFAFGQEVAAVNQVVFDSDALDAVALVRLSNGTTQLRRIDFAQRTSQAIEDPSITGELQQVTVGRHGQIYTHNGEKLFCISPAGVLESFTTAVVQPESLGYDDATDEVVVLSPNQRKVTRLGRNLEPRAEILVPGIIPLGEGSSLCVGGDGTVFFGHGDDTRIARLSPNGQWGLINVAGLGRIQSLSVGDGNRLFATDGKQLRVLVQPAAGGPWGFDTQSPFDGRAIRTGFEMMRSRTNYDPDLHSGPGWRNILAEELEDIGTVVPDCRADLNADDKVDSADLSLLLANWGGTAITYDVDKDGVTNSADLSLLLAAWGSCP
jgi:hypothetical protein